MEYLNLQPFIPSGKDFDLAKNFFQELGFAIKWDAGDYIGFAKDNCSFILQKFNNKEFAENLMLTINIPDAKEFWNEMQQKQLTQKYGVSISEPLQQPYGKEVNVIDPAGVCWHFVEQ